MIDLTGQVALVTGGAKGVGRAIVRRLAERGATVVLNYFHSHEDAKRTRDDLVAEGWSVELARASVARPEQVEQMFADIRRRHGRLDILVNNAADGALVPVAEVTDAHLDRALEVNYKGGLRCARAAAPLMAEHGGGSIVTVSALGGSQMVMANYLACAPAKAAAEAMTRYLAVEFAPLGVRVNTASAAMLVSDVAGKFPRAVEMQDVIRRATPLGRLGTPEEFADVVAFLAAKESSWITGQVILADGGLTLGATLLSPPDDLEPVAPAAVPEPAAVPQRAPMIPEPAATEPAATDSAAAAPEPAATVDLEDDEIAVVGMGLAVAGANSPEEFWELRTTGAELFVEVPRDRWRTDGFYSPDPKAEDKSYQNRCVFITGFDPVGGAAESLGDGTDHELTTLWLRHSLLQALDGVHRREGDRFSFLVGYTPDGSQHLEEAGVLAGFRRISRDVLGRLGAGSDDRTGLLGSIEDALVHRYRRGADNPSRFLPHRVGHLAMRDILPADTELRMIDTACSSSLYAIDIAVKGLLTGKQDVAVCGGAFALAPRGTVLFSKLQGLSKVGAVHALDRSADGVIFADGAGLVVLKRMSRALADGDQVLGVLKAFGSSSDGKGKAIYAPKSAGQDLAVQRAMSGSGLTADDVDWVNAHATGTPAGDLAEFTTLRRHYGQGRPAYVTSNKSLIGHTGWAAGVVSLIEVLLGLRHKTIPGQYRFTETPEDFKIAETSLEVPVSPQPWPSGGDRPRTAAISGFGFGGTNAHLAVAEYRPGREPARRSTAKPGTGRAVIVDWSVLLPGLTSQEEARSWLTGERTAADSFGATYPPPPFARVRLPASVVRTVDRCQLMILECAHGLRDRMTDFWTEHAARTGAFVGNMGPTRSAMQYGYRCYLDDLESVLRDSPAAGSSFFEEFLAGLRSDVRGQIPPSNEDSFPGMMPNVISARLANYFDLNGPNITLDSGFSSALSAIATAGRYLSSGEIDFALAGGINGNSLPEYGAIVSGLTGRPMPGLAEGAFLFALTTEELAVRAGLDILGYVDECPPGAPSGVVTPPGDARYLGAAGAVALLRALHGDEPTVEVSCGDGFATERIRLRLAMPEGRTSRPDTTRPDPIAPDVTRPDTTRPLPAPEPVEAAPPVGATPTSVRRHVPRLRVAERRPAGPERPFLAPGALVLTDRPEFADAVTGPGRTVVLVSGDGPARTDRPGRWTLGAVRPDTVAEILAALPQPPADVRVLTDLSASAPADQAANGELGTLLALHDAAFLTLRAGYDRMRAVEGAFTTLLLGAVHDGVPHPAAGLFTGLAKAALLELRPAHGFALLTTGRHLDAAMAAADAESGAHRTYPVVIDDDGVRKVHVLVDEPARPAAPRLTADSVVLAVGGARGITAEVVKEVARRYRPTIYVAGSNPMDSWPEDTFTGTDDEFRARRPAYIRAALTDGSGRTPGQASRDFDRMTDARTARRTLAELERLCGTGRVRYLRCDVTDSAAVDRMVSTVLARERGIDLLVHAAGRNRSAPIRDKDFAEFTAIRDLKVAGYRNLKRALRDHPPAIWCNFGSLLGWFGQVGEADYAAGNDFLATAAAYGGRDGRTHEVTIGWTLWGGVGMGAGELTRAYFERAGSYTHMPVEEGVRHFIDELEATAPEPVIVHLGDAERRTVDGFYPGYLGDSGFYLRRVVEQAPGSAVYECLFDLDTDGYLAHHRVNGAPTLPGTFVTEMAAEAALHLVPDRQVIAFEDLEFHHFLRVRTDGRAEPPKRIHASVVGTAGDVTTVDVRITGDVLAPSGVRLIADRPHFSVRVLLAADFPAAPTWDTWPAQEDQAVPDPYHLNGAPVSLTGPFVATHDTRSNPLGKRARYAPTLPTDGPWRRFRMPVILWDALARTGVLDLVDERLLPVAAPLSIRRVDLYQDANDLDLVAAHGHLELYATPAGFAMDADASNRFVAATADGRVVTQLKDIRATVIGYVDARTGGAAPAPGAAEPGRPVPGAGTGKPAPGTAEPGKPAPGTAAPAARIPKPRDGRRRVPPLAAGSVPR